MLMDAAGYVNCSLVMACVVWCCFVRRICFLGLYISFSCIFVSKLSLHISM
jgi:hypothetical protein